MPQIADPARWRTAVTHASQQVLASRWRSTVAALEAARAEHAQLSRAMAEARVARKAAKRIQELEHLRTMLARELLA